MQYVTNTPYYANLPLKRIILCTSVAMVTNAASALVWRETGLSQMRLAAESSRTSVE